MDTVFFGLFMALTIAIGSAILLGVALYRDYPVRSLFVYATVLAMAGVSLVGAIGAVVVEAGLMDDLHEPITLSAAAFRGASLVLVIALVIYERGHPPQNCPYRDAPGSNCQLVQRAGWRNKR